MQVFVISLPRTFESSKLQLKEWNFDISLNIAILEAEV
jgi:hypothetical protein